MRRILVINGPNLNLLGVREPQIYGTQTYRSLCDMLRGHAERRGVGIGFFLVDGIQQALGRVDGLVLNPGAYTHTSIALLDALKAVGIPTVEVHISDVDTREEFRRVSYVRAACVACIKGHGFAGYCEAIDLLLSLGQPAQGEEPPCV